MIEAPASCRAPTANTPSSADDFADVIDSTPVTLASNATANNQPSGFTIKSVAGPVVAEGLHSRYSALLCTSR